jgi:hypothetical protein
MQEEMGRGMYLIAGQTVNLPRNTELTDQNVKRAISWPLLGWAPAPST